MPASGATIVARGAASGAPVSGHDHEAFVTGPEAGTPLSAPPGYSGPLHGPPDLVGVVLSDRYRVLRKLGEGGMGSVYLAEHTTINKKLAIKVLSSEYSHKPDLVERFLQEARAASMIEQQNVVEITDFGSTPNGSVFFAMEYLQGEDLAATVKNEGALPWPRVQAMMLQICEALCAAHEAGIVHRDMKPENCYRLRRGSVTDFIKVLDFGIAKVTSDDGEGGKALTRTGMIFGTPEYMSPEQAKGERVDHRVDIYATGVILYELLTGRVPFTADTFMGILTKHMFEAPPAPSVVAPTAAIPHEVETIILKALQKDREYRFQTMREMATAISLVGTGRNTVSLIDEPLRPPQGGEIHYRGGDPEADARLDLPPRSNAGLLAGLGVGVAAVAAAAYLIATGGVGGSRTTPRDLSPPPDAVTTRTAPAVAPPVVAPVQPAHAATVKLFITAPGIEGAVHDGVDDAELGRLNTEIEVPFSAKSRDLYLRASGYEELLLPVVPNQDKTLHPAMSKLPEPPEVVPLPTRKRSRSKSRSRSRSKKRGSSKPTEDAASTSEAGTKKDPPVADSGPQSDTKSGSKPKSTGSPDLKNPFEH